MRCVLALLSLLVAITSAQTCTPTQLSGDVQPLTQCIFGLYDFTPLSQVDIYGTDGTRQYVHRLCGAVQDPLCPPNSSACSFSNDPAVCDAANSTTKLLSTNAMHKMVGYISDIPSMGVSITAVSPDPYCSNGQNHTVVTNIYCSGPNVPERLASISSLNVGCFCQTTISLYSSLACPAFMNVTAPVVPVVTRPTALPCTLGQFGIDLRSQFANDFHFESVTRRERYVMNLCGPAQDLGCTRHSPRGVVPAACKIPYCRNSSSVALMYSYQTPTWQYTNAVNNSAGYTMINYNDLSNILIIRMTCDLNATQAVLAQVNYPAADTLEIVMRSSLVCVNETALTLPTTQCISGCCGMGYDWTPLRNVEITGFTGNGFGTPWAFTMCTSLRSDCDGAMACSKPGCYMGGGAIPLSYWRGSGSSIYWSYVNGLDFTGGVRMTTANGELCGSGPRRTVITFKCDPSAFVPRAGVFVEMPVCVHTMEVFTTVVCAAPHFLGGQANIGERNMTAKGVVVPAMKPVFGCQFAGYDFSELSTNDFSARIWPYMFITRVCGAMQHPKCMTGENHETSVCQLSYGCMNSPEGQWIVSLANPYLAQWGFVSNDWRNGVTMSLRTGDLCGNSPRSIIYNFVCDEDAVIPYQDEGYESPGSYICNYFMRIRTRIVCKPPPNGNSTGIVLSSSTGSAKWSYPEPSNGASVYSSLMWTAALLVLAITMF